MSLEAFHPAIRRWFVSRLGEPTAPQQRGWPLIRSGAHTLIAAPTGSGKTLAAFLSAIDSLFAEGASLADETRVVYVSPLKALGNDVQKNLAAPLAEIRALDPTLPEIRVLVRSGDTPQRERVSMGKRPPHLLVTTPESLYILLTSEGGRAMLRTVRTVIVDEIHAVLGDKRGSHLALSLERLEALVAPRSLQRIGLSATQKPLADVGRFLTGAGRECALVDEGHVRAMDLEVEIPPSPLEGVCSHETWSEIYARIAELIREHTTTLVFVGTRKMAERVSAQLAAILGENDVACHHSSLSKERRLDAEQRLKAGSLRALVATASLELGIDIGDVDLTVQIGVTRSIAALLQRVGRSGHGVGRTPKGRLFPLTRDELVEAAALMRALRHSVLDRTPQPSAPLDILAQQIVASCAAETWDEAALFERLRRAHPYRDLERSTFEAVVEMHSRGRRALLHKDGVQGRLIGTRRARMTAIQSGGAIPDSTQYRVILEPESTFIGAVDEDFAIEANAGDVFQLGATSWRILRVERGVVRVADAHGVPPSLPFWVGEAPVRTKELSAEIGIVREHGTDREWLERESGLDAAANEQLGAFIEEGRRALGTVPTQRRLILERFFDESGGTQLVLHAPLGGRINRAFGLALRKRFCRRFGFELQAAAKEDAIVLSLGPQHSFPLEEVFDYLHPDSVRELLEQAVLASPLFKTRWRWNVSRALLLERSNNGQRVPAPLLRMRADDLLVQAFPDVVACGETLPPGDIAIPMDHPIVRQTLHDCLHEAMDVDGLIEILRGLRDGSIERVAIDTPEPSPFARSILSARPYAFLDDAPLEERRTQAVYSRRTLDARTAQEIGALDPTAVQRVREEAWPDARDAEEVHEALLWMGFVTVDEARAWKPWLDELAKQRRIVLEGERWLAAESSRDPKEMLRGRMEALGPVHDDDPLMLELEREGAVMRIAFEGRQAWCDRRLLARIQRYTLDTLRREIEPVSTADFLRFLGAWQHADEEHRLDGPAGVLAIVRQLAGFEAPSAAWEKRILSVRVSCYRPEWLDQLALSGEIAWGRVWGSSKCALRSTPIAFFPRDEMESWLSLAPPLDSAMEPVEMSWPARGILQVLVERGALFPRDLEQRVKMLSSDIERGLEELIALGLVTSDSYSSLRQMLRPAHKRREPIVAAGRWSLFRAARATETAPPTPPSKESERTSAEFVARALLRRYGVIFRALLARERTPVFWRDVARACRTLELRGDIRGGRFVGGHSGEQFALPDAIPLLRKIKKRESNPPIRISPSDPLNLHGILTPGERIPSTTTGTIAVIEEEDDARAASSER